MRKIPEHVEEVLRATAEVEGKQVTVLLQQDSGNAGKGYAQHTQMQTLRGFTAVGEQATGSKYVRAKADVSCGQGAQHLPSPRTMEQHFHRGVRDG